MNRPVAVLFGALLAAVALAGVPGFQESPAVQESLARMPARFRAEWLQKRGLDASRYTEYHKPESASTGLRLVGKYGRGESNEVTGRGNLVALTLGSEVALLNFAKPDSPIVLSEIQLNFIPRQTALHDSFLLTCGNGIEIWNIADSTHPVYRNVIPYGVGDFAVYDTFLYFASYGTFYSYSIGNTVNPRLLGTCQDSGYVATATATVAVARELNDVLGFIDVSNPAVPKRVGTYANYALAADARGNICVASIYWSTLDDHFRFDVLDISDPANVTRIGSIDSVGGWGVHLSGPFAFVSGYQNPAYEFTIVDIQDSAHPRVVSSCATPGDNYAVWADWASNWAYVADMKGLATIDMANINAPVYDTSVLKADVAQDVSLDGDRAYVADYQGGLRILDVTDPARPVELGGIDSTVSTCWSAAGRDSFVFVGWNPSPFFRSMLVSDPTRPTQVGSGVVQTIPEDMVLRDTFVYLVGYLRFNVVNVARPRQPVLVGSCVLGDDSYGLSLVDSLAYVASYPFAIINVADPTNPVVVDSILHGANGVFVKDTLAYLADGGLYVYNVARPTMPFPVDSLCGVFNAYDVVVTDSLAYVACQDAVLLLDVSSPHNMRVLATSPVADVAMRLTYSAPYVYASCYGAGVWVFESTQVAVAEPKQLGLAQARKGASVVRGVLNLEVGSRQHTAYRAELLDVSGRKVMNLRAGANDVRALAPGVYFVRQASGVRRQASSVSKVVLTK
ncbi:MAG TPA: hypothetical protein VMH22_09205 [bacterium]|nr:hypothetical protein [bacterium]